MPAEPSIHEPSGPPYRTTAAARTVYPVPGAFDLIPLPDREGVFRLHFGPDVAFQPTPSLGYWHIDATFVARARLDAALCEEAGLVLPESVIEATRYPHVHRAARAATLVRLGPDAVEALTKRGIPLLDVVNCAKRDYCSVARTDGERIAASPDAMASLVMDGAPTPSTDPDGDVEWVDSLPPALADRIVRAVWRDEADTVSLQLANDLSEVLTDRGGRTIARAQDIDATMDARLAHWDRWIAAATEAGRSMERDVAQAASDVASALESSADVVAITGIGAARSITEPGVALVWSDDSRFVVPAASYIVVENVRVATPGVPFSPPFSSVRARSRGTRWSPVVVVALFVLAVLLVALSRRAGHG